MSTAHKTLIHTVLAAAVALGATVSTPAMASTYVSWGWNAPAVRVDVREACPGPNYTWVTGRWEWSAWYGWQWHRGFWEYVAPVYSVYHPAPAYYHSAPAYYHSAPAYYHSAPAYYHSAPAYDYHPNYNGQVHDRDDHRDEAQRHDDRDDHRDDAQRHDDRGQSTDRNARRDGASRR